MSLNENPQASDSSGSLSQSQSLPKVPNTKKASVEASASKRPRVQRNKKKAPKAKSASEPEVLLESQVDEPESGSGSSSGSISSNAISIDQIRSVIRESPDRLEEGLRVYADDKGKPVGIAFESDVGPIDLLALDDAGGLVVVVIAPQGGPESSAVGKDVVSMALERVGWIRKHVADQEQEVRAIVLIDQVPDELGYAAAAVASTLEFKTYHSEIAFSNVEI